MNERWIGELLDDIARFEAGELSVSDIHIKINSVLNLLERDGQSRTYEELDLAESELEEIEFARLLDEQRSATDRVLASLKATLIAR